MKKHGIVSKILNFFDRLNRWCNEPNAAFPAIVPGSVSKKEYKSPSVKMPPLVLPCDFAERCPNADDVTCKECETIIANKRAAAQVGSST